jgi:UDP-N-acetylglucosamine 2-epimerase (non-hydrolysing)/GDP/UDP-N,N'-diacetylbacillosamine 2-epimerase (hydrolysing)
VRRIAAATFSRAEASSFLPIMRAIEAAADLELVVIAGGAHLADEQGRTVAELEEAGFPPNVLVEMPLSSTTPEAAAESIGHGTIGFAHALAVHRPDLVVLVGDRFELLAAASAALPLKVPVAHVSGGDVTEGAFDNLVRQALSALSHVHFVAMEEHAERLRRCGEEPWRIHVTGEPALDSLRTLEPLSRAELEEIADIRFESPLIVATVHPTTLAADDVDELGELLAALDRIDATVVFTAANADPGGLSVTERVRAYADARESAAFITSLGQRGYYSLLGIADAMVGNSSSGIWEAPSFRLPVVNVGNRQQGRIRAANVIDVEPDAGAIEGAVRRALGPGFRASLDGTNPYGDGHASERIVDVLRSVDLGVELLGKRFGEPAAAGLVPR